ncbi:hypothetical protein C8R45DRAFT_1044530 [Mycena sanguinolenta]|nr:hypothetical protein C8R45DRAFT_1044530 [Mycena sanguinolenta]
MKLGWTSANVRRCIFFTPLILLSFRSCCLAVLYPSAWSSCSSSSAVIDHMHARASVPVLGTRTPRRASGCVSSPFFSSLACGYVLRR